MNFDQGKWDRRFLNLAEHVASWSKDPSTQVGAVVAHGKDELGLGYNGFPEGYDDSPHLYADRSYKLKHIIHGELNAIRKALRVRMVLTGCTLYTWPFMPCSSCAEKIIEARIARVVAPVMPPDKAARWKEDMERAAARFAEEGVELVLLEVG